MPYIKLNNIQHSYKEKTVFQDLILGFQANQISCLLGDSGCGKTTLLRLIAGLEIPQAGEIIIGNKTVTQNHSILVPPHRRNTGFIFQDLALWPHFTVYKNIAFGLEARKEKHIKDTVFEALHTFGLQEFAEKYPHQLSGGQKQLVALARSMVLKPEILLMDEPLSGLDVKRKRKIIDLIKNLKQSRFSGNDLTIIYVTHDHREAFAIADNIVVLADGKVQEAGSVEQIKNAKNEYVKYFLEY